jgi:hypothetical protein
MVFILLPSVAANEEDKQILDALAHIEPSLLKPMFLQLILQENRYLAASLAAPMAIATCVLSYCL